MSDEMPDDRPAIQVQMHMLAAIFKVFQGDPPWGTPYYHMSRETAYERLKLYTQQDFGEDISKWEEWLETHHYQPIFTKSMLREAKARLNENLDFSRDDMYDRLIEWALE